MACAGADALLTMCLWKAGFAITDPDPSYRNHSSLTLFDPEFTIPCGGPLPKATKLLTNLLTARTGSCSEKCMVSYTCCLTLAPLVRSLPRILAFFYKVAVTPWEPICPMSGCWTLIIHGWVALYSYAINQQESQSRPCLLACTGPF